jgi:PilZ domain-containing protein
MNLKSLLLSPDEKTVRILRRVLSDLEIESDHCTHSETAVRRITRERFEAIIVDCADLAEANQVLKAAKAAPVNKRALSIVLVESNVGLRGGFEMGAHFVLHKPLSNERARSSFRAVRALMKRERRGQLRVAVQVPVLCKGTHAYHAKTLDLCEGGMAIQFKNRVANEGPFRFMLELPGVNQRLELNGELAWEGHGNHAGVRFSDVPEQQKSLLRKWLNSQLPEPEQDDPPVDCQLSELSNGGCYLKTSTPFPHGTRILLTSKAPQPDFHAVGIVRVAHPEFGMGVEFLKPTTTHQDQVQQMIATLRSKPGTTAQLQVEPDGLEPTSAGESLGSKETGDPLVDLFRSKPQVPIELFLQQMQSR